MCIYACLGAYAHVYSAFKGQEMVLDLLKMGVMSYCEPPDVGSRK